MELPPIEEDQVYRREMAAVRAAGGEVRVYPGFLRKPTCTARDGNVFSQ